MAIDVKSLLNFTLPGLLVNDFKALFGKDNMYKRVLRGVSSNPEGASDILGSVVAGATGSALTGAQREANQVNIDEAQKQREFEERMSNSTYQRTVSDMQAAGINPSIMLAGGASGVSTPSGSTATSVTPSAGSSLQEIMSLLMLPMQLKQIKAQTSNIEADTANKRAQTDLNTQLFELNKSLNPLVVESKQISNNLGRKQIELMNGELNQVAENTKKLAQETKESEKRELYYSNLAELEHIKAEQAVELFPYTVALQQAQTASAKAAASLSMAQAAYQRKLLRSEYIDAIFAQAKAQAKSKEAAAAIDDLTSRIKTGRAFDFGDSIAGQIASGLINYPIAALSYIAEPLMSVVKVGVGANSLKKITPSAIMTAPTELAGLAGLD